jgi:uncharacterized protein (TIGR03545 family)/uncharacterized protein (TIGR03546 family)
MIHYDIILTLLGYKMNFLKILKTLNSAQSSWQIALAFTFGMISGFLPLFTLVNLFIIIIVFTFNIPIAIFILSSAIFASIAYILDPYFASLGYEILSNPEYKVFFTNLYNFAPTLWSSFNHTIVMGSFIVSMILFIPLYFSVKFITNKYRIVLEKLFSNSRFLSFLNPFSEKKIQDKPGVFRLWGTALIITIISSIIIFALLVFDPLLKFTLEYSLSKASKKKFTIEKLTSSLSQKSIDIENITIESDNTITIKQIKFDLDLDQLLHKNIFINSFIVKDILVASTKPTPLNTVSKKNEQVKVSDNKKDSIKNKIKEFSIPDANSVLEKENLQSLKEAKKIQLDINNIYKKYKNLDKSSFDKEKIKALKKKLTVLVQKSKKVKNINDINEIINEAKLIKQEIALLEENISSLKKEYKEDKKLINTHFKTLKTLPKKEYNHLIKKYTLDQNGAMNIIGTYISNDVKGYTEKAIEYYKLIKPYISNDDENTSINERRLKGMHIYFNKKISTPSFVLNFAKGNISINSMKYNFEIKNLSSSQEIYKKDIIINTQGTNEYYDNFTIKLIHNLTNNIQTTNIISQLTNFKKDELLLAKKLHIKNSTINANSKIKILNFDSLEAQFNSDFTKANLKYGNNKNKTNQIVGKILSNIHSFDLNGKIKGKLGKSSLSINSNLDKQINKGFKKVIASEMTKFKTALKIKLKDKFKKELGKKISNEEFAKLEELLNTKDTNSLKKELSNYLNKDAMTKKLKDSLAKKAKAKIESEVKKKLQKDSEKKLKKKTNDFLKDKVKSFF